MTPLEIEVLLSLPESVRAALATIPGPGWFVSRNNDGTDAKATALHEIYPTDFCAAVVAHGRTWAWCPDTAALLEVAHDLGAVRPELMRRAGGGWRCDAMNLDHARLDAYLTAGPPEDPAWEDWCGKVQPGDPCEVVGRTDGIATDDDGRSFVAHGGNVTGTVLVVLDDFVGVYGADGITYCLDWSDVGPVTGY